MFAKVMLKCKRVQLLTHSELCDLEIEVWGHRKSLETAPFDRSYTTYY